MFFAALLAASCGFESGYSENYQYQGSFEYSDFIYEDEFFADSTYFDTNLKIGIGYGDMSYYHKVDEQGAFQGGFRLSYLKASGLNDKPEGYVSHECRVAGKPSSSRNTYAVFTQNMDPSLMPEHDIVAPNYNYVTCTINYCWVNNTEKVYEAVKKNFGSEDRLYLTATGYLDGVRTGTAEITLAKADSTMYNWTKFDLSALGMIDYVDFEVYTSNRAVPTAFCMDEVSAHLSIQY